MHKAETAAAISIARRLDFDGPQPSYFGVPPAVATPMRAGAFVGDTRAGGSCNAEEILVNPHCHGTHTECVGHVTEARHHVIDVVPMHMLDARLLTLAPERAGDCSDDLPAASRDDDWLLSERSLARALGADATLPEALVVRTQPNDESKRHRQYLVSSDYAYFSRTAMATLVRAGVRHLLIDTPSLDRLDDDGALELHRLFWNMPAGATAVDALTRADATITEMIYVPDRIADGYYRLMLQPAPFGGDATPSNPTLFMRECADVD